MISGMSENAIEFSDPTLAMTDKCSCVSQPGSHMKRHKHQAARQITSPHFVTELTPVLRRATQTKQNTAHPLLILTSIDHQCTAPELYSTSTPVQTVHIFNWSGFIPARSYPLSCIEFGMCWSAPITSSLGCRTLSLFRRRCPSSSPLLLSIRQLVQPAMFGQF